MRPGWLRRAPARPALPDGPEPADSDSPPRDSDSRHARHIERNPRAPLFSHGRGRRTREVLRATGTATPKPTHISRHTSIATAGAALHPLPGGRNHRSAPLPATVPN
ncbi:MAG: hypothetical protein AMXMBFR80_06820 [Dehalococcoidia bacterium]